MSGSVFGNHIHVSTFGESHGKALGAVIDGFPAGMKLSEDDLIPYMNRRRPGSAYISTSRQEEDVPEILSGVFDGMTTGTPIAILVRNTSARSSDYDALKEVYRPGHADYTYAVKYGIRDYRGGGRSSGRETIGRVLAGAMSAKLLKELGIDIFAYTKSIGSIEINPSRFDRSLILRTRTAMPDRDADEKAVQLIKKASAAGDSLGGVVEIKMQGIPAGLGEPVFHKLDASLAQALMSIGAVKAVEVGDGTAVSACRGTDNNDCFRSENGQISKITNHAGGILGGISDGSEIVCRCHFKPTPSVSASQETVSASGENLTLNIKGRHDPVIVPRAVVVAESMCHIVILDALLGHMSTRISDIKNFYN